MDAPSRGEDPWARPPGVDDATVEAELTEARRTAGRRHHECRPHDDADV